MRIKYTSCLAGLMMAGAAQAALVGEWRFEGGSVTNSAPTGSAFDGTVVGTPSSVSGVEAGTDAFIFDGTSANYISIPAATFAGISTNITVSMWTFGDDILGTGVVGSSAFGCNIRNTLHSHTPWSGGQLYFDGGGVRHNYTIADSSKYKAQWNHIVYTMDTVTGDKKVYINGVQDSPDWNAGLSAISGITSFYIGRAAHNAQPYYGKIDEFQIYDEVLDATAVSNLYASYTVDAFATAIIAASETSGAAPLEVIFDGSGSTASGTITSYDWDFGDGNTASGAVVTNTYDAGTYTAELVVASSEGVSSTSTVEIAAFNYVGAELAVSVEGSTESNLPSFYTDDLGQTSVTNISGEGTGSATSDTQPEKLFNGTIGDSTSAIGDFVRINNSSSVTIEFDLSENTLGYDITEISTINGWGTLSGGRANQGYGVTLTFADDSQAILVDPAHWAPNDPAVFWTKVTMVETNGLPMARGVKAITWDGFFNANAGGDVVGREFDILGTPTTTNYVYAGIAASALEGPPPLEVVFDGSASYSSTDIVSYAWSFGDGNTDSGPVVTNTYVTSGDYTAQLIVEDADGRFATNSVAIDVFDFATAVAEGTPLSGDVPLPVVFNATNSASSGTFVSYAWDFGDGNVGSGAMVTNTYYISGLYTATLTVTDSNGLMDSDSVDLVISKAVVSEFVQYSQQILSNNVPVVSTNDLAQTAYLSSEGTGGNEAAQHAQLFNGLIGNQDLDTNDDGEVRLTSGEAITVTFDTSVNTYGYDIDLIETFAGWTPTIYDGIEATNNLSRSNQGYELIVGFADGSFGTFAGPSHWEPNGEAVWTNSVGAEVNDTYWTKVGFTGVGGNPMLRNVESITFDISNNARAGGVVIYREFDVFGEPSTGFYPSSIVISSADGGDSLSWDTDSTAYIYSVQTNANLVIPNWGTWTNVVGTPPVTTVVLPPKTEDQQFIRVIVE
ncbi:PKD domain-containing protein [Pontiella sp.]|uniref:PKD domain-containing protein n=1 Tax=Pontiella sp. TaxID=2837462 RepID=UPI0035660FC8